MKLTNKWDEALEKVREFPGKTADELGVHVNTLVDLLCRSLVKPDVTKAERIRKKMPWKLVRWCVREKNPANVARTQRVQMERLEQAILRLEQGGWKYAGKTRPYQITWVPPENPQIRLEPPAQCPPRFIFRKEGLAWFITLGPCIACLFDEHKNRVARRNTGNLEEVQELMDRAEPPATAGVPV